MSNINYAKLSNSIRYPPSGHGQFQNFARIGRPLGAGEDGVTAYAQDEPIGEVLLSVSGERCTKDDVIWELLEGGTPRAVKKDVLVCLVFDMCRSDLTVILS